MIRPRRLLSYSLVLGLSVLAVAGCKKGEKANANQEAKPTEATPVPPADAEGVDAPPLAGDLPLIDKTLEALGDATLAKARKAGDAGGLPLLEGDVGIACGTDPQVTSALAAIGFDPTPLKAETGFRFINVCVGWRPYLKPYTEMFWMISAGATSPETGVMPHRRCLRVYASEEGFAKAEITDGLCLELHVKSRARAMAAEEGAEEGDTAAPPAEVDGKEMAAP